MTARTLNNRQLQIASLVVAFSFVISGGLGLIRQAIIGSTFGAGVDLDAFNAAYRIPEMLFTLIAGGALGSAFIPVFSRFLSKEDPDSIAGAWRLASAVMTLVGIAAVVFSLLGVILAMPLTTAFLRPSSKLDEQLLTASLMRSMMWTVAIFSISGLVMGILNANQRFLAPALAPSMNNIGLIIGAVFFVPGMGIYGLALGTLIGAALHLVIQLPALRQIKPQLRFLPSFRIEGVTEVLILMGPRVLGAAAVQINFVVNTALTSGMGEGSLTALSAAFSLMFVVLGVIGQSVGTAIFPTLSLFGAKNDLDGFRQTLSSALRNVLFTSIPAMIGLIVLAVPGVAIIYQRGRWTLDGTIGTAWALQFFALGLPAFALQEVLARAFFALRDTLTPVVVAVGGMILNVVLSLILMRVVQGSQAAQGPFGGLALANALATTVESAAMWLLLRRRISHLNEGYVIVGALRTLGAALIMGGVVFLLETVLRDQSVLLRLLAGIVGGGIAFELGAIALGLPEARTIPMALLRRFRRGQVDQDAA